MEGHDSRGRLREEFRRTPATLPDDTPEADEEHKLDSYTLVTSPTTYSIDGSSAMPFLIFSKIEVFQLSSFMTWSYSTTAAVNPS